MNIGIYSRLLKKEHRPFIQELFKLLAEKDLNSIRFLRAIEEEFNISI